MKNNKKINKYHSLFIKLTLALFSIVLCLAILEVLFALFLPQKTFKFLFKDASRCWQSDSNYHVKFKPNCKYTFSTGDFRHEVNINALGTRGFQDEMDNSQNVFRIIFTGDSFIFGNGLEDNQTIPYLLEEILNEKQIFADKTVDVINAGFLGGRSPDGHLIFLRSKDLPRADMHLMGFFIYNDITPDMDSAEWVGAGILSTPQKIRSKQYEVTEDGLYIDKNTDEQGLYKNKFLRNFNTYIFFGENFKPLFEKAKAKLIKPNLKESLHVNESTDSQILGNETENCVFGNSACHRRLVHIFDDLERVFIAGRQEAPRNNFGVVIIPADFQVNEEASEKYHSDSWAINGAFEEPNPQPQARVKEHLNSSKIPFVDLLEVIRANKSKTLYYPNDSHFNPEGARIAAMAIADWLEKQVSSGQIKIAN
jgi:lysophospholipase L1-like esterase